MRKVSGGRVHVSWGRVQLLKQMARAVEFLGWRQPEAPGKPDTGFYVFKRLVPAVSWRWRLGPEGQFVQSEVEGDDSCVGGKVGIPSAG